jgi:hypothetical protein
MARMRPALVWAAISALFAFGVLLAGQDAGSIHGSAGFGLTIFAAQMAFGVAYAFISRRWLNLGVMALLSLIALALAWWTI